MNRSLYVSREDKRAEILETAEIEFNSGNDAQGWRALFMWAELKFGD